MRVVVVGASGNVGTAVLRALAREPAVTSIVGVARRVPRADGSSTVAFPHSAAEWVRVDLTDTADAVVRGLDEAFLGADAVVHLAWAAPSARDSGRARRLNLDGSRAVADAVVRNGVRHLVLGSTSGVYSPGPLDGGLVREDWPRRGVRTSSYSVQKAAVERMLDEVAETHPRLVVTRVRPALMLQREAGAELGRYFLGPLGTRALRLAARRAPEGALLPAVPALDGLRLQVMHTDDAADAYRAVVVGRHPGAFNLAPEGWLTSADLADVLSGGRAVAASPGLARTGLSVASRLRLAPIDVGWFDMARADVVLDASRARELLHWAPTHDPRDVLRETVEGVIAGTGAGSPPLLG
ncbi:NAD-dependent epimerase/dehydratase family protein [Krasilnikoviella flava]|uniref:Nucleoside-diphosphate-sugar epimerase n=1 Tax=Krasilnikoviella flava TaxID=526729 RepID=A0A1T5ILV2_9MICO|nr:NAD-dependent epimerase/dehydratase family protein [Krasilnikoviella flava]SKC40137.1 Nucleoside-diphosphate-sugar epimerase [Krasilnikoviella flava]